MRILFLLRKNHIIIFIIVFLNIQNILFTEEVNNHNVEIYMLSKYGNYPVNINFSLDDAFYIYRHDEYALDLTQEQTIFLESFIEKFCSDIKHINELERQSGTNTFAITRIYLEYISFRNDIYINVGIVFYSDKDLGFKWLYDEDNDFWYAFNYAIYSFDGNSIELLGWYH